MFLVGAALAAAQMRWRGGRAVGLLGCWAAGLLGCWAVGVRARATSGVARETRDAEETRANAVPPRRRPQAPARERPWRRHHGSSFMEHPGDIGQLLASADGPATPGSPEREFPVTAPASVLRCIRSDFGWQFERTSWASSMRGRAPRSCSAVRDPLPRVASDITLQGVGWDVAPMKNRP